MLQYVLEGVIDLPKWNNYLPDDIDADNDGTLNEKEVEQKFKSYVKDAFDQLDKDSNKLITKDEFTNASINLDGVNKVVDIAFNSFPLKLWLAYGDRNQDGFISEDDLVLPENRVEIGEQHQIKDCGGECAQREYKGYDPDYEGDWNLHASVPAFGRAKWDFRFLCLDSFGENEAEVFCRELGHKGVESLSSINFDQISASVGSFDTYKFKFGCKGSESSLEECTKSEADNKYDRCPRGQRQLASVNCVLNKDIGEVHLAGGKNPSSGDLHIGNKKYCGDISPGVARVVCTQLGFLQGVPQITTNNFFTDFYGFPTIQRGFDCNGSEEKLQDCQIMLATYENSCLSNGIICNPGDDLNEKYEDVSNAVGALCPDCSAYDSKRGFHSWWEFAARHLFIADTNGDSKVSMEELQAKAKDIAGAVFQILDQTNDGVLSVSDFTTISVKIPAVIDLVNKLFEVAAKGTGEINLVKFKLHGFELEAFDGWRDGIINLKDISALGDSSQMEGLLSILSRNMDLNQDGIILKGELENYLTAILNHLDEDNNGVITLDEVYKLMQKSQFTCLQIEGIRTFVTAYRGRIDTHMEGFLANIFTEFDLNHNGEIVLEELNNAHAPCDENKNPHDWNGMWDSSNRIPCAYLMNALIDIHHPHHIHMVFRGLSGFSFGGRHPGPNQNRGLIEKIANSACVAMQPSF